MPQREDAQRRLKLATEAFNRLLVLGVARGDEFVATAHGRRPSSASLARAGSGSPGGSSPPESPDRADERVAVRRCPGR